jgi:hypothetical protein
MVASARCVRGRQFHYCINYIDTTLGNAFPSTIVIPPFFLQLALFSSLAARSVVPIHDGLELRG